MLIWTDLLLTSIAIGYISCTRAFWNVNFTMKRHFSSGGSHRNHIQMNQQQILDVIGESISTATGLSYKPTSWQGGYGGGGGGASTGTISDDSGLSFFVKKGNLYSFDMLNAEYQGVREIYQTNTIKVPKPICIGTSDYESFVVFERLSIGGRGKAEDMAKDLAAMHKCISPNGMFGWKINNTCGATPQPNTYTETWAEFWDKYRLGHMLQLAKNDGAVFPNEDAVRAKVREVLNSHKCQPSLVHGDLWSGNQGFTKEGEPVIFDPAVYYGDREVDIAMTQLFGSNSNAFYETYQELLPIPEGYELRRTIYNLYHILNHYVLFGGGYLGQAKSMMDRILSS